MADQKVYVPKQRTNRGVAGYRGVNVVVVGEVEKDQSAAPVKAPRQKAIVTTGKTGLKQMPK